MHAEYACAKCGQVAAYTKPCSRFDSAKLACLRCRARLYCSRACQVADWPEHKASCVPCDGPGEEE